SMKTSEPPLTMLTLPYVYSPAGTMHRPTTTMSSPFPASSTPFVSPFLPGHVGGASFACAFSTAPKSVNATIRIPVNLPNTLFMKFFLETVGEAERQALRPEVGGAEAERGRRGARRCRRRIAAIGHAIGRIY